MAAEPSASPSRCQGPDSDGDSVCDASDICTNVGGGRDFVTRPKPKLVIGKINTDTIAGNDKLTLGGEFSIPFTVQFSAINPSLRGARVVVRTGTGVVQLDQTLPAGTYGGTGTRGWKTNAKQSVWQYIDKTGTPLSGITGVKITDKSKTALGRVRIGVKGANGTYPVVNGDQPLEAIVVLGNQMDAASGYCGEADFSLGTCVFNGFGNQILCFR